MVTMSPGLIAVSFPSMIQSLDASVATLSWVQVSYSLVVVSLLVPFSRLADRVGGRRLYVTGLALFGLSALVASVVTAIPWLIAARCMQGIGSAMAVSINRSILAQSVERRELGRAMGRLQMSSAAGGVLSLALGGIIVSLSGWQSTFVLMGVGGILASLVAFRYLPPDPHESLRPGGGPPPSLPSALLFMAATAGLTFSLTEGVERGLTSIPTMGAATAFVIAGLLFPLAERRGRSRLISPHIVRDKQFSSVLLGATMSHVVRAGFLYLFAPLYLSAVWGLDAAALGWMLVTVPLLELTIAPLSGRWTDRSGMYGPTVAGMALVVAGILLLMLGPGLPGGRMGVVLVLALVGGGFGLFHAANNATGMRGVKASDSNAAAGLLAMSISIGMTGGVVVATAVYTLRELLGPALDVSAGALASGRSVLVALGLVALATAAVSHLRLR